MLEKVQFGLMLYRLAVQLTKAILNPFFFSLLFISGINADCKLAQQRLIERRALESIRRDSHLHCLPDRERRFLTYIFLYVIQFPFFVHPNPLLFVPLIGLKADYNPVQQRMIERRMLEKIRYSLMLQRLAVRVFDKRFPVWNFFSTSFAQTQCCLCIFF